MKTYRVKINREHVDTLAGLAVDMQFTFDRVKITNDTNTYIMTVSANTMMIVAHWTNAQYNTIDQ